MKQVFNYSSIGRTRSVPFQWIIGGILTTYGGVLALAGWTSVAITSFHGFEGPQPLYQTDSAPYYTQWGGDIQTEIGFLWGLLTTIAFTTAIARRRAPVWLCVIFALGNLFAMVPMWFWLDNIMHEGGIYL